MRSLLYFTARLYLVVSVLAGVPAGASQTVLCLAPNGHVEIEAGNGRCVDYPAPVDESADPSETRIGPNACNDCVDLPLGVPVLNEARGRGPDFGSQAEVAAPALTTVLIPAPWIPSRTATSAPGAPSHSAFAPSRTTILRN